MTPEEYIKKREEMEQKQIDIFVEGLTQIFELVTTIDWRRVKDEMPPVEIPVIGNLLSKTPLYTKTIKWTGVNWFGWYGDGWLLLRPDVVTAWIPMPVFLEEEKENVPE